ncbi:MAG: hypothetical protein ACJA2J_002395 [Candidatus Azotimanducaceae bacterium]|jgi:hypothetical protein
MMCVIAGSAHCFHDYQRQAALSRIATFVNGIT